MIMIMKNNFFICPRQYLSQRLVGPSKHLKQTKKWTINLKKLRISTGWRQTSWLFTSTAKGLNSCLTTVSKPGLKSGRDLDSGPTDCKSNALTPRPCCDEED